MLVVSCSSVVVRCVLFVGCCVLFGAWLLFVVCCLCARFAVVCWLLLVVYCGTCVVARCAFRVVCCSLSVVRCLLFVVCCFLFRVGCALFLARCRLVFAVVCCSLCDVAVRCSVFVACVFVVVCCVWCRMLVVSLSLGVVGCRVTWFVAALSLLSAVRCLRFVCDWRYSLCDICCAVFVVVCCLL